MRAAPGERRIRLLLVDDHVMFREAMVAFLEQDPRIDIIGQAADGAGALRLAREHQPDVVLLDVVLPDLDGLQVASRLRAACPETAVVMMTGAASEHFAEAASAAGVRHWVTKSDEPVRLIQAVVSTAASGQAERSADTG